MHQTRHILQRPTIKSFHIPHFTLITLSNKQQENLTNQSPKKNIDRIDIGKIDNQ